MICVIFDAGIMPLVNLLQIVHHGPQVTSDHRHTATGLLSLPKARTCLLHDPTWPVCSCVMKKTMKTNLFAL